MPSDRNQTSDLKRSETSNAPSESRWVYRDSNKDTGKDYTMSPMYQKENIKSE